MANTERKSFVFYADWYKAIADLNDAERLEIYDAIMSTVFENGKIELSGVAGIAMRFIRQQLERDSSKWLEIKTKRAESGRLGGLSKAKQNVANAKSAKQKKQSVANVAVNVNDYVNVNVDNNNVILNNSGLTTTTSESEILAEVKQFFNKTVDGCLIPKVKSITGERRSMLLARIKEYSLEEVYEAFTKAASSNFLNGGGNKGFRADFTWIVRPNNFPKVLEGNYDNRNNNGTINNRSDAAKQRMADAANLIARLAAEDDARQKVW